MPNCAVEYIWLSGADAHHDIRSKVKTVTVSEEKLAAALANPQSLELSVWNFDGSSTKQALGKDTEILIKPVRVFVHPFFAKTPAFVALCECYLPCGQPTPDNTRFIARSVFEAAGAPALKPWFGLEQEYVLTKNKIPLGWPADGTEPAPQGPYYCSTGAEVAFGRNLVQAHYETCLSMGVTLSGMNAEVMPGQWEYQVGPCEGIESGDHAILARWAFLRLLEPHGVDVNFDSKPKKGDWNGSGMHTNFSTEPMRAPGGMEAIKAAISNLGKNPIRDIVVYGSDNNQRLSGHHETSRLDVFNFDIGTRNTSCRIPNQVLIDNCGYFEDRRPSASADPYLVTSRLFASSCNIPSELLDAFGDRVATEWQRELIATKSA